MTEHEREFNRIRQARWRANHPHAEWPASTKQKERVRHRRNYDTHPEHSRELNRIRQARWRENHPEEAKARRTRKLAVDV